MAKTRILMIGWEYPPHNSGGLGVACQGIVENLVDQGEEVVLVLPTLDEKVNLEGFRTTPQGGKYKILYIHSPLRPYVGRDGDEYCGDLMRDVELFSSKVALAAKSESYDLIHVHDWLTVPTGVALKEKTGKPLVMHVHSTEYDRTAAGFPNSMVGEIERRGFEKADLIITVSKYTKQVLVDRFKVPEEKITVVHNGNDYSPQPGSVSIEFLKNSPVVIFVGRLTIQKGPEYFLDLARRVLEKRPETIFVFAGNGDMYQHLLMTSAYLSLSGSVLFAGFLRDAAKDRLYQRADVFVMPSVSEPFGIVALEAAAAGKPVIVSKTSGVAEVLPSAIKLDFWDSELMSKSVLSLINKSDHGRDLGEKVMKEAGAVTWDKAAAKIKDSYRQLLLNNNG